MASTGGLWRGTRDEPCCGMASDGKAGPGRVWVSVCFGMVGDGQPWLGEPW